jgi:acetamidase/formamidase
VAENTRGRRPDIVHERQKEDWHPLLDALTKVRAGDEVTIELLDADFGDEYEAERLPLAVQIVGADGAETLVTMLPRA